MEEAAGWVALGATVIAALMTASNLGARLTGWGFFMFTLGSIAWITADVLGEETPTSLLVTHCVLLVVNIFGVWRWLGQRARYEDGRNRASERSRWQQVPTLFSGGALIGAEVRSRDDESLGKIVDAMFESDDKRLAYLVISEGGLAGAGETLRAVPPANLSFDDGKVRCDLSEAAWESLPPIENDDWPTKAPRAAAHGTHATGATASPVAAQ